LTAALPADPANWGAGTGANDAAITQIAARTDFLSIMLYDLFGSFTDTAGPNAPLNASCDPTAGAGAPSAITSLAAWTAAGAPAHKLVLGLASYAHSFAVRPQDASADGFATLSTHPAFDHAVFPLGGGESPAAFATPQRDSCEQPVQPSGVWRYKELVAAGAIFANGTARGVHGAFDDCSATPMLYNETAQTWFSYDDPRSFAAKGQFVLQSGMAGVALFETPDDFEDVLVDAVRASLGM
jgi:chitinase